MNPGIDKLQAYPFEKLAALFSGLTPNPDKTAINLSIGEPKHETPAFILDALRENLDGAANYPKTRGSDGLREAIRNWLISRFKLPEESLSIDRHILPVNGTREALFAICQCLVDSNRDSPTVVTGNPFYQIYEGAAFLAGATPRFINASNGADFASDYDSLPAEIWRACQVLYVCSPNNPTGRVCDIDSYRKLLELAERHDFIIAADECYSEIYYEEDSPPVGLLQAAAMAGNDSYSRCLVFHSLSKRSNVPGMRSGFVAGDEKLISAFFKYRTYQGCAMAPFIQYASLAAWQDENHVRENRRLYREKFDTVAGILQAVMNVDIPPATFYLWPETPIDDEHFSAGLRQQQNVTVLPGSYLSREVAGENPGNKRVRMALVASLAECEEAAIRIRDYLNSI